MMPQAPKYIGYFAAITIIVLLAGIFISQKVAPQNESNSSPQVSDAANTVREDGKDFTGFAIFPTWSTLEPATFPLLVDGQAQATWFFENSFPVEVRTREGILLGTGFAHAQDRANEQGIRPFYANVQAVTPTPPYNGPAELLLLQASKAGSTTGAQFSTQIFIETAGR